MEDKARSSRVPEGPLQGALTVVRRATSDDAGRLATWHSDPEVARYWDGTTYSHDEMLEQLARPEVDPYIVEAEDRPVGYLQACFDGEEPDQVGLDMFLVPEARGRGLGPDAARKLAEWLLSDGGMGQVTVDPYVANERAVRAWARAGFEPMDVHPADNEHTQPWILMVRRRSP